MQRTCRRSRSAPSKIARRGAQIEAVELSDLPALPAPPARGARSSRCAPAKRGGWAPCSSSPCSACRCCARWPGPAAAAGPACGRGWWRRGCSARCCSAPRCCTCRRCAPASRWSATRWRRWRAATRAGTSLVFGYLGGAPLPFAETSPGAQLHPVLPGAAAGAGGRSALGGAVPLARAAGWWWRCWRAALRPAVRPLGRLQPLGRGQRLRRHGGGAAADPALAGAAHAGGAVRVDGGRARHHQRQHAGGLCRADRAGGAGRGGAAAGREPGLGPGRHPRRAADDAGARGALAARGGGRAAAPLRQHHGRAGARHGGRAAACCSASWRR